MSDRPPTIGQAIALALVSGAAVVIGILVVMRAGGDWWPLGWVGVVLGVPGLGTAFLMAIEARRQEAAAPLTRPAAAAAGLRPSRSRRYNP